ncbi:hypothetical protein [Mesorhizobium sp. WSM3866]|uniref:hypothetical protein n=1 Tax=Mesorhizobium sp. WSM3866 TaxID=422271 RepID=UPI0015967D19|nr:hypothetical protein [Mesorhizobium sp. WSM3866]
MQAVTNVREGLLSKAFTRAEETDLRQVRGPIGAISIRFVGGQVERRLGMPGIDAVAGSPGSQNVLS